MFGKFRLKKRDKVTDSHLDRITTLLETKKLPIVVLDGMWYEIKDALRHLDVEDEECALKELLKEQGKLITDLKEYAVVKQKLMEQVLVISQEVNEKGDMVQLEAMDKTSQALLKLNETMEECEKRALEVGELIKQNNKALIERVVVDGYHTMAQHQSRKNDLEKEIDRLRRELVEKTEERKQYDQAIGGIYNYLHKIIGYQDLDKLDCKLGE